MGTPETGLLRSDIRKSSDVHQMEAPVRSKDQLKDPKALREFLQKRVRTILAKEWWDFVVNVNLVNDHASLLYSTAQLCPNFSTFLHSKEKELPKVLEKRPAVKPRLFCGTELPQHPIPEPPKSTPLPPRDDAKELESLIQKLFPNGKYVKQRKKPKVPNATKPKTSTSPTNNKIPNTSRPKKPSTSKKQNPNLTRLLENTLIWNNNNKGKENCVIPEKNESKDPPRTDMIPAKDAQIDKVKTSSLNKVTHTTQLKKIKKTVKIKKLVITDNCGSIGSVKRRKYLLEDPSADLTLDMIKRYKIKKCSVFLKSMNIDEYVKSIERCSVEAAKTVEEPNVTDNILIANEAKQIMPRILRTKTVPKESGGFKNKILMKIVSTDAGNSIFPVPLSRNVQESPIEDMEVNFENSLNEEKETNDVTVEVSNESLPKNNLKPNTLSTLESKRTDLPDKEDLAKSNMELDIAETQIEEGQQEQAVSVDESIQNVDSDLKETVSFVKEEVDGEGMQQMDLNFSEYDTDAITYEDNEQIDDIEQVEKNVMDNDASNQELQLGLKADVADHSNSEEIQNNVLGQEVQNNVLEKEIKVNLEAETLRQEEPKNDDEEDLQSLDEEVQQTENIFNQEMKERIVSLEETELDTKRFVSDESSIKENVSKEEQIKEDSVSEEELSNSKKEVSEEGVKPAQKCAREEGDPDEKRRTTEKEIRQNKDLQKSSKPLLQTDVSDQETKQKRTEYGPTECKNSIKENVSEEDLSKKCTADQGVIEKHSKKDKISTESDLKKQSGKQSSKSESKYPEKLVSSKILLTNSEGRSTVYAVERPVKEEQKLELSSKDQKEKSDISKEDKKNKQIERNNNLDIRKVNKETEVIRIKEVENILDSDSVQMENCKDSKERKLDVNMSVHGGKAQDWGSESEQDSLRKLYSYGSIVPLGTPKSKVHFPTKDSLMKKGLISLKNKDLNEKCSKSPTKEDNKLDSPDRKNDEASKDMGDVENSTNVGSEPTESSSRNRTSVLSEDNRKVDIRNDSSKIISIKTDKDSIESLPLREEDHVKEKDLKSISLKYVKENIVPSTNSSLKRSCSFDDNELVKRARLESLKEVKLQVHSILKADLSCALCKKQFDSKREWELHHEDTHPKCSPNMKMSWDSNEPNITVS